MQRKKIAVDVDEVLFPMLPTLLPYHNLNHGTNLKLEDMYTQFIENITGDTTEQIIERLKAYVQTSDYLEAAPLDDAKLVIELSQEYELYIVTARNSFYRGSTEKWLEQHFGETFPRVHYTHQIDTPEVVEPKYVICERLGLELLIDDSLHNVIMCAEHGIEAILFGDYAWNQADSLPDGVTRCHNWQEVLEYLEVKVPA